MRYLVTGSAGFIGFHLAERLLQQNHEVVGVDCFLDSYPLPVKQDRAEALRAYSRFTFYKQNLLNMDLVALLEGVDVVFHQAGQAGTRASWGSSFEIYLDNNVKATQQLLEAARIQPVKRIVYASSSSVYGEVDTLPVHEKTPTQPVSPYGVSKLAAEHLCMLYWKNFGVPTIALRYFTVFGPRPRPDMCICIFSKAILANEAFEIFGDGTQSRSFTYIEDIVDANLKAASSRYTGEVFNISGDETVSINDIIRKLERMTGRSARIRYSSMQKGDIVHTYADTTKAKRCLDYHARTGFDQGLAATLASVRAFYKL